MSLPFGTPVPLSHDPSVSPGRVLLVEDDLALLSELAESMTLSGLSVATASRAEDAVLLVSRDSGIRVVVTDLSLGEIGGIELIRKLSKVRRNHELFFIVISGFTNVENAVSALRLGAFDFISKPIVIEELVDSIRKALRRTTSEITVAPRRPSQSEVADLMLLAGKHRASLFGHVLFDDPMWIIMVDLYASTLRGRSTSVKDLCIASGCTNTTALRHLNVLYDSGLIERVRDDADQRRVLVRPSQTAMQAMSEYYEWFTKRAAG